MLRSQLALAVAAALVAVAVATPASAHNWMRTPLSRNGNTDETAQICDSGTMTPIRVNRGDPIATAWTQNHAGNHHLYLYRTEDLAGQTDHVYMETHGPGNGAAGGNEDSTNFVVPADAAPGAHVLQYRWANYRNCADLYVVDESFGDQSGTVFRLGDDNGEYDAATDTYTCDDGSDPIDDPENEGLMRCGPVPAGAGAGSGFPAAAALGLALILFCAVGLIAIAGYAIFVRQTNQDGFTQMTGRLGRFNEGA